ncbi:uncharacterized protein F5Z01DRAFT_263551 [Emericellopsis atlantica]|uniref:Uncharacterized protein n=1 Tax=Emericellopsis atlantica TaxID=2614577 RepID=A0A9P8CLT4_9HYPO|nr:uncharacterized protein F5Z01DRAFT_263551 [Emericellopsis atlantica]KAG9251728.1 hypothetical protein F5Z01DRAFT_263551 [Emericellopsis atlantica]
MEAAMGARILGEVEEMSLEEILDTIRTSLGSAATKTPLKTTHLPALDEIAARHFRATQAPTLALHGRHLPLLYKLTSTLVAPPHSYALLVIDLEGRFDATRLTCPEMDARHIYIHRPSRPSSYGTSPAEGDGDHNSNGTTSADHLRALVAEAGNFMLYGAAAAPSASRQWWGTIVVGGMGAGQVVAGWKGWLRISREETPGFALGTSAEEALTRRSARQSVVEAAGWIAESQWGDFVFREEKVQDRLHGDSDKEHPRLAQEQR